MRPLLPRFLLFLSLALNGLLVIAVVAIVVSMGGVPWLRRELGEILPLLQDKQPRGDYAHTRCSVFAQLPVGPDDLILLGDSILDYGEWHELLEDPHAKNRAINGDDTHKILARLDQVTDGKPRRVVLLCGINSIQTSMPFEQTTREYARIVARIISSSDSTDLWLLPVLPVNSRLYRTWIVPEYRTLHMPTIGDVAALNAFIRALAVGKPRIHMLDLPGVLDPSGELREEYTVDGIHLNGPGLRQVATLLKQEIPLNH
jgi:lysophospholipase L1-like esterase